MSQIHVYLTFNGNCREAMEFYQSCLGGQLCVQTLGESPFSEELPLHMKQQVLHATLSKGDLLLTGSDMVCEEGLSKGNAVSLSLHCSSEEELRTCYERLAAGGKATYPPEHTFWGSLFGGLTDKFGYHWLLQYSRSRCKSNK